MSFSTVANALLIDFTEASWGTAITNGSGTMATMATMATAVGDVTLTAGGYTKKWVKVNGSWKKIKIPAVLTFNGSGDQGGCSAGIPSHGLSCAGDGIGVNNDGISQSGSHFSAYYDQTITIDFAQAVNINNLFLLDLFGSEETGEIAIINGDAYQAPVGNLGIHGGFYATGFGAWGISSIVLSGNTDHFSDYALAAIDVELSPVPLPGAFLLFGTALLGFLGFKKTRA